jgi:hypothetical protein
MLIHLSIPSKNSLPSLDEAWRLFISSGDHTEVSSNSLADVINGFWQFYYVMLQSPSDLVHIHLHRWICSEQIWTARICAPRSTVGIRFWSPPAILSLSGGGGVRNWACISRAVRIKAPRSTTLKRFRTPFAILPLIKGGGSGMVGYRGRAPFLSCHLLYRSPPYLTVRQGSFPLAPPCPLTSVHLSLM